jgi:hypothetical protein
MRDLTTDELRAIDKRVIEVLRGLQLYEPRGAVDGAFAEDVAVLAGFVRGEIREAVYRMTADQPAATETARRLHVAEADVGRLRERTAAMSRIILRSLASHQLEKLEDARPYLDDETTARGTPAKRCICGAGSDEDCSGPSDHVPPCPASEVVK